MKRFLHRILGSSSPAAPEAAAFVPSPLDPERPLYVVGDVHGRADLLERIIARIAEHAADAPHDLVFVGDYIDRGEDSRAVLERLQALEAAAHVTCLSGNHEQMLLDFLDDPATNGRRWLRSGGLQTLASFGVGGVTETASPAQLAAAGDEFLGALGPLAGWLRARPLMFESGNILVVHAAADPNTPASEQVDKTLLWGHPKFAHVPRQDGLWVVHGHTIVEAAGAEDGRISVDTGAYATGRLTAAVIAPGHLDFLATV